MKLTDSIKYAFIKMRRNKKNIFSIILICIAMLIIMGVLTFDYNFDLYIKKSINNNYGFKTLNVSPLLEKEDRGLSLIDGIEHVIDAYPSRYESIVVDTDFKDDKHAGSIELVYGDYIPEIKKYELDKYEGNVVICPKYFYPSVEGYANKNTILRGDDLINKNFKVWYYLDYFNFEKEISDLDKAEEEFKVIGTYDNTKVLSYNYDCYTSYKNIERIKNAIDQTTTSVSGFFVVVDESKNIDYVKEELTKLGFDDIEIAFSIDQKLISRINLIKNIIISTTLIALIILLSINIKKKLHQENNLFGLYKAQGYSNKDIMKIYIYEMMEINVLAWLISLVMFISIYFILKSTILSFLVYLGVPVEMNITSPLISFVVISIFSIITTSIIVEWNKRKKVKNLVREK